MARKGKKKKMKTRKSVTRRIKVTGSGKLLRKKGFGRHLKAKKSKRRTRRLSKEVPVKGAFEKKIKQVLGIK